MSSTPAPATLSPAPLTAGSLAPYDLAFISVEVSTFFTLVFALTLLHILCCVYTPTTSSQRRHASPTSLESLAFLTLAYACWIPLSNVLKGCVDSVVYMLSQRSFSDASDVNNFYFTYVVEQTGLWEVVDAWTINVIGRQFETVLAIAAKVLITWLVFEFVVGVEAVCHTISELRAGQCTISTLLCLTAQRWSSWISKVKHPQLIDLRSDVESAWQLRAASHDLACADDKNCHCALHHAKADETHEMVVVVEEWRDEKATPVEFV